MEEEGSTTVMAFKDSSTTLIKIGRELPDFLQSSNPATFLMFLVISTLFVSTTAELTGLNSGRFSDFGTSKTTSLLDSNTGLYGLIVLLFVSGLYWAKRRPKPIYLVDFSCYKPEDELKTSIDFFFKITENHTSFNEKAIEFQKRIITRSGLGDETYLPRGLVAKPQVVNMEEAQFEVESVLLGTLDTLFDKTGVKPHEIGILIVNCSVFNPAPSISAMVVNRYKLKPDIKSYSLAGMGCSGSNISIDLAKNLLKSNRNTCAIVVSLETATLNWYNGNDRSMLMSNCIFRLGGAAILLSNRCKDRIRSKYQLVHTLRTHTGADDNSYNCVTTREDDQGLFGISLGRELTTVAGKTLNANITNLAPLVLPLSEKFKFLVALVQTKFMKGEKVKPYTPDFRKAFQHFCIHCGGRGVLDGVQKNLQLNDWYMEPSRMTLHRWGNTSSSSLWYELAYTESKGRVSKGDRVWQIAFGSGFKCNSAVWKALKRIPSLGDGGERRGNPWVDSIDKYPVKVPIG